MPACKTSTMDTRIAGPVLATIMYELANASSDTAGMLLGRIDHREVSTVSDTSDVTKTEVVRTMFIEDVATCRESSGLWASDGSIDEKAFRNTVPQDALDRIVGWYCFRRYTRESPSIRERKFHQELSTRCSAVDASEFVFNVWSWKLDDRSALHTYVYTFFRNICTASVQFPVLIENLESVRKLAYKETQSSAVACAPALEMMRQNMGDHVNTSRDLIERSYRDLVQQLKSSAAKVGSDGGEVAALTDEVEELRRLVKLEESRAREVEHVDAEDLCTYTAKLEVSSALPALNADLTSAANSETDDGMPPATNCVTPHKVALVKPVSLQDIASRGPDSGPLPDDTQTQDPTESVEFI